MDILVAIIALAGLIFSWRKVAQKLKGKLWIIRHLAGAASGVFVFLFIVGMSLAVGIIEPAQKTNKPQKVTQVKASEVISVSAYENSLSEQPAVSIAFGESDTNYCSLTMLRGNVKSGYSVSSIRRNTYQSVSFDCNWEGVWFIENSNKDTYVKLEIASVDLANKKAEVVISARLSEYKRINENPSGDSAELNRVRVIITGRHFDNLTKKM